MEVINKTFEEYQFMEVEIHIVFQRFCLHFRSHLQRLQLVQIGLDVLTDENLCQSVVLVKVCQNVVKDLCAVDDGFRTLGRDRAEVDVR